MKKIVCSAIRGILLFFAVAVPQARAGELAGHKFLVTSVRTGDTEVFVVDPTTFNTFRPATAADLFNFGPANYFVRPDERYNLGAFAHYEIAPWVDAYLQTMFMDDVSTAQIAAGGIFLSNFSVNCANPFLTAQEKGLLNATAATGGGTCASNPTGTFTGLVGRRLLPVDVAELAAAVHDRPDALVRGALRRRRRVVRGRAERAADHHARERALEEVRLAAGVVERDRLAVRRQVVHHARPPVAEVEVV